MVTINNCFACGSGDVDCNREEVRCRQCGANSPNLVTWNAAKPAKIVQERDKLRSELVILRKNFASSQS